MTLSDFEASLQHLEPPAGLAAPLLALWWDRKSNWAKAHHLVDDLTTRQAMAVHAYLHRREGDHGNAAYWDRRAGATSRPSSLEAEWTALAQSLLATTHG